MASKSSDHTGNKSVRDSDCDRARKSSKPDKSRKDGALAPEETKDEELLIMLEELSKTIDTAHIALAGQQAITSKILHSGPDRAAEEQIGGFEFPSLPPTEPARRRVFVPALAAVFGAFFGIAALAALWLFWNSPDTNGNIELAKKADSIAIDIAPRERKEDATTQIVSSLPARTEPILPARTEAILPARTEAIVAPDIAALKNTPKSADVIVEKPPAIPVIKKAAIGKDEEALIMERGHTLISAGDIAGARLAFEYAAQRGSADAMFALAQTYDVDMLAEWNVIGIEPDAKLALEWYGRAAQKGHDPADARANELEKLTKRQP